MYIRKELTGREIRDLINVDDKTPNESVQVCPLRENGGRCDVSKTRVITHGPKLSCDEKTVVCPVRLLIFNTERR